MKVYVLRYGDADLNEEDEGTFSSKKKALAAATEIAKGQIEDDTGDNEGWVLSNDEIEPGVATVAIFDENGCEVMWWTVKETEVK